VSDWVLVPCLVTLRTEFNTVAPTRRKSADGSIGDSSHTSSSDHSPDEDSAILRDHDADSKNEVHALDIDSTGPWPDGKGNEAGGWFDRAIKAIVERHRLGIDDRLQYVIWRGHIASRSWGWTWRVYTGTSDPHTNHAHFSSRYTTVQESDTSPWGLLEQKGPDMPLATDQITLTADTAKEVGRKAGEQMTAATLLQLSVIHSHRAAVTGAALVTAVQALAARDYVDEQALGAALAPGIAAALSGTLANLPDITPAELREAIAGALRDLVTAAS
jgi:hypothetical protein